MLVPDNGGISRFSDRMHLERFLAHDGGVLSAIILLERPAGTCAFVDNGLDADVLGEGGVTLRRIGRGRAALRMAVALVRCNGAMAWVEGLRVATRGNVRQLGDWLYEAYRNDRGVAAAGTYRDWLKHYDSLCVLHAGDVDMRADAPRISVVMPVYDTRLDHLRAAIESVLSQRYPHWELCIADDASEALGVTALIEAFSARDDRVRWVRRERNGHISAATRSAMGLASGDIIAFLDHDDMLHPDALREVASAFVANPDWGMVYTDEDKITADGSRHDPYFKPDFNPDLLCAQNYICHLAAFRRGMMDDVDGFRSEYDGSQDWDLVLRITERLGPGRVGHIPRVLYHWRAWEGSTAGDSDVKPYARDAALLAIGDHLVRTRRRAEVTALPEHPGNYRVIYPLPSPPPRVSVLIPTRDQPEMLARCVRSVDATRGALECEFLIMDNGSVLPRTAHVLGELTKRDDMRLFRDESPFNFSALNNRLAAEARGDVLLFLNDDIEAVSEGWLQELVSQVCRPEVGVVGAKLYYPDGRIQHAGIFLGVEGIAANAYRKLPGDAPGHMNRALLVQELSAVTAACLAVRKKVFAEAGGFEESLPVAYNDVDFCLRLRRSGLRIIWTPFAELVHHESTSRGAGNAPDDKHARDQEDRLMRERWGDLLNADPAYSPNLGTDTTASGLGFPPRR